MNTTNLLHDVALDSEPTRPILSRLSRWLFGTHAPIECSTIVTRRLQAVMFTDIVGSTKQSLALGDTRWGAVLDRHDEIIHHLVERHGGRPIKQTGDGLLATFDTPSDAVTCGTAVLDALGRIGVQARVGAHVGEVGVRCDGDITGVTVNLAAKVEAYADAGEFWVSSTLRDALLGSSTVFNDRGYHDLAGVDQLWQLYSVAPTIGAEVGMTGEGDTDPIRETWRDLNRDLDAVDRTGSLQ